jgi:hypothetical protein
MVIAEQALVEKEFAFVATRDPLGDVSISFHGDEPFIATDVEACISRPEDRTLVDRDEMGRSKKKDRDDPPRPLQPRMPALRAEGLLMAAPWPRKRSR